MSYKDIIRARKLHSLASRAATAVASAVGASVFDQPDPTLVCGIDTSHWTGVVDWEAAKAGGLRFAIVKMLDGKNVSRFAEENYRGAVDAGILVGGYQWLYKASQVSPGGQAREYLAYLRDHPVQIRPAVDFEWSREGERFNVGLDDLWGHVSPFETGYGQKPMIYTATGYWAQYGSLDRKWAEYPSWQARYGPSALPMPPWPSWTFWQFTDHGEGARYGVPPEGEIAVDLNYWSGTLVELYEWCGLSAVEPIPVPEGPPIVVPPEAPAPPAPPPQPGPRQVQQTQPLPQNGSLTTYCRTIGTREIRYYVAKFSMPHAEFVITRPSRREIIPVTVRAFLEANNVDLAINGDGFRYLRQGRKVVLKSAGFAAANGEGYPEKHYIGGEQTLYISRDNQVSLNAPSGGQRLWNAISFPNLLLRDGAAIQHPDRPDIAPRTVLAVSADGQTGYFLLVDGNELAGTGATLDETMRLLVDDEGPMKVIINLDGGGSTTGARKDGNGKAVLINLPSDDNVAGVERPVVTHIGIRFV